MLGQFQSGIGYFGFGEYATTQLKFACPTRQACDRMADTLAFKDRVQRIWIIDPQGHYVQGTEQWIQ